MSHSLPPTFDKLKAKAMIKAKGTSAAAVARSMGLQRQTVGHWLRGRGEPDMKQLHEMARAMGCHWLELVTDDTMVVFQADERARIERIRALSPERRRMLDQLLETLASKSDPTSQ